MVESEVGSLTSDGLVACSNGGCDRDRNGGFTKTRPGM